VIINMGRMHEVEAKARQFVDEVGRFAEGAAAAIYNSFVMGGRRIELYATWFATIEALADRATAWPERTWTRTYIEAFLVHMREQLMVMAFTWDAAMAGFRDEAVACGCGQEFSTVFHSVETKMLDGVFKPTLATCLQRTGTVDCRRLRLLEKAFAECLERGDDLDAAAQNALGRATEMEAEEVAHALHAKVMEAAEMSQAPQGEGVSPQASNETIQAAEAVSGVVRGG
jgi:hypothetical protein